MTRFSLANQRASNHHDSCRELDPFDNLDLVCERHAIIHLDSFR